MAFQRDKVQLDAWLTVQYLQLGSHCFCLVELSNVDQEDNPEDLISLGCLHQNISIKMREHKEKEDRRRKYQVQVTGQG